MAKPDEHEFQIKELLNEKYNYYFKCSCGWEGRAYTIVEVNDKIGHHRMNQNYIRESGGIRGGGL